MKNEIKKTKLSELEKCLMEAANILRGLIDVADFKQYIFPLLFFKRISNVWSEEYQQALDESGGDLDYANFRKNHRFQIPDGKLLTSLSKVTKTRRLYGIELEINISDA